MRILVVEDDVAVAEAVRQGLQSHSYAVDCVGSAEEADAAMISETFDLIILDLGLPRMDGLEWLRLIRRRGMQVPVLILTARDGMDDRVDGLELGADDYLVKPFDLRELAARCRALIRRSASHASDQLLFGTLTINFAQRDLRSQAGPIELTPREWSLFECLLMHVNEVVRKDRLIYSISTWDDDLSPNAIEVYISRLRAKLEPAGIKIRTVRGLGYRMDDPALNH